MKNRNMILNWAGAGVAGTLAFTFIVSPGLVSPVLGQTAAGQPTVAAAAKKKPTSATPQMIDEAIQRSQARTAKAKSSGKPEQWGSEEPFTYTPGKTF